jgi:hypothetical protein
MNKESRTSRIIVYLGSTTIGTLLAEHAQNGSKKKKNFVMTVKQGISIFSISVLGS